MAIIAKGQSRVAIREDGRIVLDIPMDGRRRKIVFEADAALATGIGLGNLGFDAMDKHDDDFPVVTNVRMKPFDQNGMAALSLTLANFGGPASFLIGHKEMLALAAAADGALELADTAGKA